MVRTGKQLLFQNILHCGCELPCRTPSLLAYVLHSSFAQHEEIHADFYCWNLARAAFNMPEISIQR